MTNRILINAILVVGFCMGTVGAAGFSKPPEDLAWPLFLGGLVVMTVGGILHKRAVKTVGLAGSAEAHTATGEFQSQLQLIVAHVVELDEHKEELGAEGVRDRIDALLRDEYFDFTSRHEEWVALLGFKSYASVWNGVATAERLLSRAWSMTTDGHFDEGKVEIPLARRQLEEAMAVAAHL